MDDFSQFLILCGRKVRKIWQNTAGAVQSMEREMLSSLGLCFQLFDCVGRVSFHLQAE